MGLFDIFGGGGSHAQNTSSTSTVENTQLAGGGIGGPAIYTGGNKGNTASNVNVNINQSDYGAIGAGLQAATDISGAALALGAAEAAGGTTVALAGLNHAQDAYTSSLSLVGDVTRNALALTADTTSGAFGLVGGVSGKAIDSVNRFATGALDSNTYIAGKSLDATSQAYSDSLRTVANQQSKVLGAVEDFAAGAIAGNQQLAAQVSQSSTQSVNDSLVKIAMYAALAVAVIFIMRN